MGGAEPTTIEEMDESLASVAGMINLMRAALPRKVGRPGAVLHQISGRYEPDCKAVWAALKNVRRPFGRLNLEFTKHYSAPNTNRVIRALYRPVEGRKVKTLKRSNVGKLEGCEP